MSCNGCRVLRKGCSETCILRPCLQWMDTAEAQGHATLFLAKFFGRSGLMSFISNVPHNQRPALFQSLLYESCGRTVNPVTGAVGLLWTGNWHVCQEAVETVLRGGTLKPIPEFLIDAPSSPMMMTSPSSFTNCKRQRAAVEKNIHNRHQQLYLSLTPPPQRQRATEDFRPGTPSLNSEESGTTVSFNDNHRYQAVGTETELLNLFV